MAAYPPPIPPPGFDPRAQRRYMRDQMRAQRDAMRAQAAQMRYQMRSHRRGSILGPIVLISIGILFLLIQTNRIENHVFWDWYGKWWPFLLVVAGIVVLAEWAFDQYVMRDPQRTPYRRSIGGGVVILLIFVAAAGAVARKGMHPGDNSWILNSIKINPDNIDEMLGDKHESDQTADYAFPAGATLAVVNPRGDVTINGTSDDGRVHVAIHKQVWQRSDSAAEERAQKLAPSTSNEGSAFTITMPSLDGARSDLILTVPPVAATTVTANRGDIHIAGMQTTVAITANHGDIELSGITGAVLAHINSGSSSISAHNMGNGVAIQGHADDITLTDVKGPITIFGDFFGTTHLEHVNGSVHFHTSRTDFQLARLDGGVEISPDTDLSADQAVGPVVLTTHDRNITFDRISGDISVTNRNGTVNVTAAPTLGNLTIEDRNGSIRTTMPEHSGFSVQANTTDGNIDNEFGLSQNSEGEDRKSLIGSVAGGGPMVRLTTTHGDISIRKGAVEPMPPEPPAPPRITLTPPAAAHAPAAPHTPTPSKPAKP